MRFSAGLARTRLASGILLTAVVLLLWLANPWTSSARAQEGEAEAPKPTTTTPAEPESEKGMIAHMLESVGWGFGFLLGFVSVTLIAIIVLLAMELRMGVAIPPGFVEDFTDVVNKRQFKAAYDLARNDGSFLGRVMTTGMGRLQYGIEDAREAAFNMVDSIKSGKEQLIAYLATIGTLGPLLGLVGTVYGMIKAFMVISQGAGIDPKKLADAISHALVVTLVGVALSVPAIFFHTFFRNRLIRLSMDTGNVADDLLTQMYHNSKKPGGAETTDARPVSAPAAAAAAAAGIKPK
jgi:biopolymer transport protein ExbB